MGFFCTKPRLRSFSATHLGCTQCFPKPDMQGMERSELYLGYEGIMLAQFCNIAFSTRQGAIAPPTVARSFQKKTWQIAKTMCNDNQTFSTYIVFG